MYNFTHTCLYDALLILMQKKEFSKITITELCKLAGVSRATFYRNYYYISDIIAEHIKGSNFGIELPTNYEDFDFLNNINQYFDFCIKNKQLLTSIVEADLSELLLNQMDYFSHGPFLIYLNNIGFNSRYEISAYVGLWYKMSIDWIKDGMPEKEKAVMLTYNMLLKIKEGKI